MDNKYIDVVPDQPIAEGYNSEERELDVPDFPQGEQKVKTIKVEVEDIESGEKVAKKLGEYQGELSPNPGYGEDGETKDATKIHLVEESIPADGGKFVDQNGIRVEREPVNYVGGLYVKGKPVNPEEGSDDSNVYRFAVGEVMTEEIAALLKSGDVLLVNNMAFVINKINSDHAWFRGFYTDGSVEGKVSVAQLEWEDRGDKKLAITFNEVSGGSGTKLYKHDIQIVKNNADRYPLNLVCTYGGVITKDFISSYSNRLEGFYRGDSTTLFMGQPFPNAGFIAVKKIIMTTITIEETPQQILRAVDNLYQVDDIESIIDIVTEL